MRCAGEGVATRARQLVEGDAAARDAQDMVMVTWR